MICLDPISEPYQLGLVASFLGSCIQLVAPLWRPSIAKKNSLLTHSAGFIETMDCLPVTEVPDGEGWTYEIKLDGFRLEAVKTGGEVTLYSRRHNVLNAKFQYIADA